MIMTTKWTQQQPFPLPPIQRSARDQVTQQAREHILVQQRRRGSGPLVTRPHNRTVDPLKKSRAKHTPSLLRTIGDIVLHGGIIDQAADSRHEADQTDDDESKLGLVLKARRLCVSTDALLPPCVEG